MDKLSTKDRLQELASTYGITQIEMCKRTGIPKSTMSLYWNGKRVPKQNILTLIADTFNVQETWLMGYDVPMKEAFHDELDAYTVGLLVGDITKNAILKESVEKLCKLQPSDQEMVVNLINSLYEKVSQEG